MSEVRTIVVATVDGVRRIALSGPAMDGWQRCILGARWSGGEMSNQDCHRSIARRLRPARGLCRLASVQTYCDLSDRAVVPDIARFWDGHDITTASG